MRSFGGDVLKEKWTVDVPTMLTLDSIGPDRFRNRHNQPNVYRALFGGQIVGQALAAADLTVPAERTVHSLHAYFLRAGVNAEPVEFAVERVRDGGRFSTRRVLAIQKGQILLSMDCSYRLPLAGFSHQVAPTVPFDPEGAIDQVDFSRAAGPEEQVYTQVFAGHYPIDVRLSGRSGYLDRHDTPKRHYYLRAPGLAGIDDAMVHRQVFAFISDFMLAGVPLVPHTTPLPGPHVFVASLDHAVWFHRPVRCDDWLLFETDSPSAEGGVNMSRGLVWDRAGTLVATLAQEVLQLPTEAGA